MYYVAHTGAVRRTGWYERFWAWLIAQASLGSITRSQDESEVSWLTAFRWQGSDWQGRLCSPGAQRVCLASICGWIQPGWVLGHDTVSLITQYGYTAAAQWRSSRPIGLQLTPLHPTHLAAFIIVLINVLIMHDEYLVHIPYCCPMRSP